MNNDLEEKFREHLKNDVHMHRKEYDKLLNQLKNRDEEIERLKDDLYKRTNAELNEQKMRIYQTNLSADLSVKLKDRDQEIDRLKSIIERGDKIRNNWEK